jgi:hypothetical protein
MADTQNPPTMLEVLGKGWMKPLALSGGPKDSAALSRLVNYEQTTSKYWPAVEALAKNINPEGFAKWEAAHLPQAA